MKTSHHEEKVRLLTRKLGDLMAKRHPPYDSKVEWCAAGLSDSTIRQESARLDVVLPAEHQAALSVFDGLLVDCPIDAGDVRAGLPEGHILISQIQFMREWNDDASLAFQEDVNSLWTDTYKPDQVRVIGPVKKLGFHKDWIMIGYTDYGQLYLDFVPELGGAIGQLIVVETDDEGPVVQVVAPDFIALLQGFIEAMSVTP